MRRTSTPYSASRLMLFPVTSASSSRIVCMLVVVLGCLCMYALCNIVIVFILVRMRGAKDVTMDLY